MKKFILPVVCILFLSAFTISNPLGEATIVEGLKSALSQGAKKSISFLHNTDGYLKNPDASIPIPLPPDAQKVLKFANSVPELKTQVDQVIVSMNRAAEDAAIEAEPIFVNAITSLTISDGANILSGDSLAATNYLKGNTSSQLTALYRPKISASLDKVNATEYWAKMTSTYNRLPFVKPITSDLPTYVTQRALTGLFKMVGKEEANIRRNPAARTSDILKKVFSGF